MNPLSSLQDLLATRRGFEPPDGSGEFAFPSENPVSNRAQGMRTPERVPLVSLQGFKLEILKLQFWSRVVRGSDADCWPFTGYCDPDGYGVFYVARQRMQATHVALWLAKGEVVPHGMVAMHSCDNPPCVNPAHLSVGTHADNHADRDAKGRGAKGERRGWAKLTDAKVIEGRHLRSQGWTYRQLADRYQVDKKAIERAVKGQTWSHVEGGIMTAPLTSPHGAPQPVGPASAAGLRQSGAP